MRCIALRSLSPGRVRYHPPPVRIFQILEFNQFNTGSVHQMFQAAAGLSERGHEVTIVSRPGRGDRAARAGRRESTFAGLQMRHRVRPRERRRAAAADPAAKTGRDPRAQRNRPRRSPSRRPAARVGAFVVNRGVSFPLDVWNRGKYRTKRVDRVVTVCEQIKDVIVESGKLPPKRCEVVYAGTDVDAVRSGEVGPARVPAREGDRRRSLPRRAGRRPRLERVEGADRLASRRSCRGIRTCTSRSSAAATRRRRTRCSTTPAPRGMRRARQRRSNTAPTCRTSSPRATSSSTPRGPAPASPGRSARRWRCRNRSSRPTPAATASSSPRPTSAG